ncbi:mitochondrial carrier protein rim2 [Grosmannia clavigera kw1407]|uniref:Mitochondrial carrier protein rim2 n=1 Tax=Grosmannia clavigera (strain kw1407 / UAMH 11150) TaxID=655863 RepID=F0XBN7_GROCL|nr:mitochondrial carrier protein rim2 [Grosmannia clavigera kw1407]EFX04876.1 mitochondrial carrier protein rim2 [Grosmannia clavigera kw1407]
MSERVTTPDGSVAGFLATAGPVPAQLPSQQSVVVPVKNAKSWSHMVAGAVGSLAAATATAPFDVIRTRLQSDFYQQQQRARAAATAAAAAAQAGRSSAAAMVPPSTANPLRAMGRHLGETMQIFASVQRNEGWRALFKGLGPTLVGTVPAKSINFYAYGNGKRLLAEAADVSQDTPWVQLGAGIVAGLATSTATNPIWLIKTRLQLDREGPTASPSSTHRRYRNSLDCVRQVVRQEGVRGLYKGMTASYLGAAESTLHWLLYEQLKRGLARRQTAAAAARPPDAWDRFVEWTGPLAAASAAKLCATLLTYPHEVVRTRLRQAPAADGRRKYTGLVQCFLRVWREEHIAGLYGGLTPHLLRTVPAAGITFGIYEIVLKLLNAPE